MTALSGSQAGVTRRRQPRASHPPQQHQDLAGTHAAAPGFGKRAAAPRFARLHPAHLALLAWLPVSAVCAGPALAQFNPSNLFNPNNIAPLVNGLTQNWVQRQQEQQQQQWQQQQQQQQQAVAAAHQAWKTVDRTTYQCLARTLNPPPLAWANQGIGPADPRLASYFQNCAAMAQAKANQEYAAQQAAKQQQDAALKAEQDLAAKQAVAAKQVATAQAAQAQRDLTAAQDAEAQSHAAAWSEVQAMPELASYVARGPWSLVFMHMQQSRRLIRQLDGKIAPVGSERPVVCWAFSTTGAPSAGFFLWAMSKLETTTRVARFDLAPCTQSTPDAARVDVVVFATSDLVPENAMQALAIGESIRSGVLRPLLVVRQTEYDDYVAAAAKTVPAGDGSPGEPAGTQTASATPATPPPPPPVTKRNAAASVTSGNPTATGDTGNAAKPAAVQTASVASPTPPVSQSPTPPARNCGGDRGICLAQTEDADGPEAQHRQRVALVIGNGAYQDVPALANPPHDAVLIAATLQRLGFAVIGGGAQVNLGRRAMVEAIRSFSEHLREGDVGLFYYSGHGLQVNGENYLVPIEANPTNVADIDFDMVPVGLVLKQMKLAGTGLNLVILDACRNNPFAGRGLRDVGGGLAQMQAPSGTLISYATQPGGVAADGIGQDSPFTTALAKDMTRPNVGVLDMFNDVAVQVEGTTNGAQEPWFSASPLKGSFQFAAQTAAAPAPGSTPAPAH